VKGLASMGSGDWSLELRNWGRRVGLWFAVKGHVLSSESGEGLSVKFSDAICDSETLASGVSDVARKLFCGEMISV
jgi:hypothetical protein